jgi:hypothetical protein
MQRLLRVWPRLRPGRPVRERMRLVLCVQLRKLLHHVMCHSLLQRTDLL